MSRSIKTRVRNKIVGADYSAQEPRLTSFISQDKAMMEAYIEGKDLYAIIAQSAFHNSYHENLEFWPEGTELEIDGQKVIAGNKTHKNPAGKDRRSTGKVLLLAATYGMSGPTAGSRLGYSTDKKVDMRTGGEGSSAKDAKKYLVTEAAYKGEELLDNFFEGFPKVKQAIEYSQEFLAKNGYVEDWAGRRRHLGEEFNLTPYEVKLVADNFNLADFNPLLNCGNRLIADPRIAKWTAEVERLVATSQDRQRERIKLKNEARRLQGKSELVWTPNGEMSNKQFEKLAKEALADGVIITANTGRRAQAIRQCFNARIQGGAASLTKLAMVNIFNNSKLKELGARLIISVHDEVLVECPAAYADEVEKLLPQIMIETAVPYINVPMKCDPYNVTRWYCDEAAAAIQAEFKALVQGNPKKNILPLSKEAAVEQLCEDHVEIPKEAIIKTVETGCDLDF